MKKYIIKQTKSEIGIRPKQKLFLKSLGLRGIGSKAEVAITPSSTSLVKRVLHLITKEEA